MSTEFNIDHVALHFVDTGLDGPILSKKEIDLNSTKRPDDLKILHSFFKDHLKRIWLDKESQKTCAASFKEASDIRDFYTRITTNGSEFFTCTCEMARQLYVASPNTASRGLLMVLLFRVAGDDEKYLGLLKMDPGRKDAVTLGEDDNGNILLDLAVRTINQVLPDPSEKILKWAIIPHPARRTFDLKVKDEQSSADRAMYFMKFLGCEEKPSAIEQSSVLVEVIQNFTKEFAPKELDCRATTDSLVEKIAESDAIITVESVVETVRESDNFINFDEANLRKKFEEANILDLCIPPEKFRDAKIQYKLPNGIIIKGPREAMENYIKVESNDNGIVIIRIETTADYEKKYV